MNRGDDRFCPIVWTSVRIVVISDRVNLMNLRVIMCRIRSMRSPKRRAYVSIVAVATAVLLSSVFESPRSGCVRAGASEVASDRAIRMRIWIPAYFYPFGPGLREWNRLIAAAKNVPIVAIVNPASGPGDHVDTNFAAILPRAKNAGVTLVGYVSTQYARKPLDRVKREIEDFLRFYPDITGFHFDEQSPHARDVGYYVDLYKYVHQRIPGSLVVTNPGSMCAVEYAAAPASDVICLFEREKGFADFQPPDWASRFAGSRFCVQSHTVAAEDAMNRSLNRAAQLRIGYVFVTDDVMPNPYDRLPSYWDAEVEAVRRINQAAPATPKTTKKGAAKTIQQQRIRRNE